MRQVWLVDQSRFLDGDVLLLQLLVNQKQACCDVVHCGKAQLNLFCHMEAYALRSPHSCAVLNHS